MAKMGMTQVKMYEDMIIDDFAPLMTILQSRTAGLGDSIRTQAKKDLGVYDLLEEKTILEERLREIKRKTESIIETRYHLNEPHKGATYYSLLDAEIEKRLDDMNKEHATAKAARDELIREIRLSGVVEGIQKTFNKATKVIGKLTKEAATLPPIEPVAEIE